MIIELDISKNLLEESGLSKNKIPELFSEVARVTKSGYHRVVVKPEVCDLIASDNGSDIWNKRERAQIQEIGQHFDELSALIQLNRPLLRVKFGDAEISQESKYMWQIGHENLVAGYLEKPVLLVEGEGDLQFFDFLFKNIAKQSGVGVLSFIREQAGGKNIHVNFKEHAVNNKNIILCICDSDRLVPEGKNGDTFSSVLDKSKTINFIGLAICTPAHETENFLPIEIFKSFIIKYDRKKVVNLEKLICLNKNKSDIENKFWFYYDTKSNERLKERIIKNCENDQQIKWAENTYGCYFLNDEFQKLSVFGSTSILGKFMSDTKKAKEEREKYVKYILQEENWKENFDEWINTCMWLLCGNSEETTDF